ncbi:unnamed protein product [marine sediment metagenome]|uniref:Uncharacterized protein n=1 Tax=marine sediment metagenome TaxID=412755 RepID=X1M997_9ZZZZ
MDAGKVALAILAVGGICGLIYLITRPSHSSETKALPPGREIRRKNKEIWEIDWDKDGLPKTVTITRDFTERHE